MSQENSKKGDGGQPSKAEIVWETNKKLNPPLDSSEKNTAKQVQKQLAQQLENQIKLAGENEPLAIEALLATFIQDVKKDRTPDRRLLRWLADKLARIRFQGESADVVFGNKPGTRGRPPKTHQDRETELYFAYLVGTYMTEGMPRKEAITKVCEKENLDYSKVEKIWDSYKLPKRK